MLVLCRGVRSLCLWTSAVSVRFFSFFSFFLLEIRYTSLNPIWLCNLGQLNNVSVSHSSLLKKVIVPTSEGSCGS